MTTGFVHVRFSEIPRVYDVYFGASSRPVERRLVGRDSPSIVEYDPQGRLGQWDEEGGRIAAAGAPIPPPRPGVYRSYSAAGMDTVLRTFVRSPSRHPVRGGGWVYVLSDVHKAHEFRLVHILCFHEDGQYRQAAIDSPTSIPTDQPPEQELVLEESVAGRQVRNCAFLSPALPAPTIKALSNPETESDRELLATTLAHASWLNDPFFCDAGPEGRAAPFSPEVVKRLASERAGQLDLGERTLYLVNPLQEALLRADAYERVVMAALNAEIAAGQDPRYVLAKRVEAVVLGDGKRKTLVQPRLDQELARTEDPISALWQRAEQKAADLLRWSGYPCTPMGWSWFTGRLALDQVTFLVKAAKGAPPETWTGELMPEQKSSVNWVSAAIWKTQDGSSKRRENAGLLADEVYASLLHTETGRKFLGQQTDRLLGREPIKPGRDDGLMGPLLAKGVRNAISFGSKCWSGVLQNLLPFIGLRNGNLAFQFLEDFVEHQTGKRLLDVFRTEGPAAAAQLTKQYAATHYARVGAAGRLIPPKTKPSKIYGQDTITVQGQRIVQSWLLLFKTASLYDSVATAIKKKDGWSAMSAVSGVMSTIDAAIEFIPRADRRTFAEKLNVRTYTIRVATSTGSGYVGYGRLRLLGTFASGLDVILALHSATSARDSGATTGHLVRALGAVCGLVGSAGAGTGFGVGLALLGIALQMAGDFIVEWTEPLSVFLRESPWGEKAKGDRVSADVPALAVRLDHLLYEYSWRFYAQPGAPAEPVPVFLEITPIRGTVFLPREAQLQVNLALTRETVPPVTIEINDVLDADYLSSHDPWHILLVEVPWAGAATSVQLQGDLTLNLDRTARRCVCARVAKTIANSEGGPPPIYPERPDGGIVAK